MDKIEVILKKIMKFHKLSVTAVMNLHTSSPAPVLPCAYVGAQNKEFDALSTG